MKSINWRSLMKSKIMSIFFITTLSLAWTACSDDSADISSAADDAAGRKGAKVDGKSNSESEAGDYTIVVTRVGSVFTYLITKNPGAKGLSHFILNLQNCAQRSSTIDNIKWATVNGETATLESSEGNTGCELTTTNFVKFDNLAEADSYEIKFEFDYAIGGFVTSTAWLKAGTSCIPYQVTAPCCPL